MKKKKLKESSPLLSLFKNYIFRERKRDFPFRREKKNGENFHCDARFISEIYASIFLSLSFYYRLRVTTTRIARSSCPIFFLLVFLPPPYFPFSTFVSFLSFSLSLSLHKGGHAGKIDSNISEIVIRSRSTHCSEIDGRVYVFAWVEGRERIHREQLDRNT